MIYIYILGKSKIYLVKPQRPASIYGQYSKINGNFRILKWRYCTSIYVYQAGYINP